MSGGKDVKNNESGVDFQALILGFSSAALYYLGENVIEGKSKATKNLPLAKQNIDIITLLKEKTAGNLSEEESHMLDQVVSDLQVKFIEASK